MQSIANLFISDLTHHGGHLARNDLLLHLLGQGILQRQVVAAVDEQLVLKTEIFILYSTFYQPGEAGGAYFRILEEH